MKLAVGDVAGTLLKERTLLVQGDTGPWRDARQVSETAKLFSRDGAATVPRGDLPAFLTGYHALSPARRNKVAAALEDGQNAPPPDLAIRKPINPDAKLILTSEREAVSKADAQHPSDMVVGFSKFPTALADPDATIQLPADGSRYDADAAFGFLLGRDAERVRISAGLKCLVGVTLFLDVTDRDMFDEEARTGNSLFAKNREGLSPLGPAIWIPADGRFDETMELTMSVNGEVRQRFRLGDMCYELKRLIRDWSRAVLEPGDILAVGAATAKSLTHNIVESPIPIAAGDAVEVSCAPIGVLKATFT